MRCAVPWYLVLVLVVGCAADAPKPASPDDPGRKGDRPAETSPAASPQSSDKSKSPQPPGVDAPERKIIYTATVNLVVEQFDPIPAKVDALVERFGAYVARSQISGSRGSPRRGLWTLRVPAQRYVAFLAAARELGEVQNVNSDSQDVTEEYCDVESRIRNKKQEEARLLQLLTTAAGRLDEVLTLERELTRVRGESEQLEGRLRGLGNLTAMSTVHIDVREFKSPVPEKEVPYLTRVHRTWVDSVTALVATAQAFSIPLVALAPWIGVLLAPALVVALVWRIRRPRKG